MIMHQKLGMTFFIIMVMFQNRVFAFLNQSSTLRTALTLSRDLV